MFIHIPNSPAVENMGFEELGAQEDYRLQPCLGLPATTATSPEVVRLSMHQKH
jgi:hypothetical protein